MTEIIQQFWPQIVVLAGGIGFVTKVSLSANTNSIKIKGILEDLHEIRSENTHVVDRMARIETKIDLLLENLKQK